MQSIKELALNALKKPNSENIMAEWGDILEYYLDILKENDKDAYCDMMDELYVSVNGMTLTKEMAEKAIANMDNEDGTKGGHWSYNEAIEKATSKNIDFKKANEYDFWYVLNMMYSDYFNLFGKDDDIYTKLAVAWLNDKDVEDGKAYRYLKKVVK